MTLESGEKKVGCHKKAIFFILSISQVYNQIKSVTNLIIEQNKSSFIVKSSQLLIICYSLIESVASHYEL